MKGSSSSDSHRTVVAEVVVLGPLNLNSALRMVWCDVAELGSAFLELLRREFLKYFSVLVTGEYSVCAVGETQSR